MGCHNQDSRPPSPQVFSQSLITQHPDGCLGDEGCSLLVSPSSCLNNRNTLYETRCVCACNKAEHVSPRPYMHHSLRRVMDEWLTTLPSVRDAEAVGNRSIDYMSWRHTHNWVSQGKLSP